MEPPATGSLSMEEEDYDWGNYNMWPDHAIRYNMWQMEEETNGWGKDFLPQFFKAQEIRQDLLPNRPRGQFSLEVEMSVCLSVSVFVPIN